MARKKRGKRNKIKVNKVGEKEGKVNLCYLFLLPSTLNYKHVLIITGIGSLILKF